MGSLGLYLRCIATGRVAQRGDQQQPTVLYEANVRQAMAMLQQRGFAALYVNRAGYDDRAAGLEAMLRQLDLTGIIESDRGDLLCVPLPVLSSDRVN